MWQHKIVTFVFQNYMMMKGILILTPCNTSRKYKKRSTTLNAAKKHQFKKRHLKVESDEGIEGQG